MARTRYAPLACLCLVAGFSQLPAAARLGPWLSAAPTCPALAAAGAGAACSQRGPRETGCAAAARGGGLPRRSRRVKPAGTRVRAVRGACAQGFGRRGRQHRHARRQRARRRAGCGVAASSRRLCRASLNRQRRERLLQRRLLGFHPHPRAYDAARQLRRQLVAERRARRRLERLEAREARLMRRARRQAVRERRRSRREGAPGAEEPAPAAEEPALSAE